MWRKNISTVILFLSILIFDVDGLNIDSIRAEDDLPVLMGLVAGTTLSSFEEDDDASPQRKSQESHRFRGKVQAKGRTAAEEKVFEQEADKALLEQLVGMRMKTLAHQEQLSLARKIRAKGLESVYSKFKSKTECKGPNVGSKAIGPVQMGGDGENENQSPSPGEECFGHGECIDDNGDGSSFHCGCESGWLGLWCQDSPESLEKKIMFRADCSNMGHALLSSARAALLTGSQTNCNSYSLVWQKAAVDMCHNLRNQSGMTCSEEDRIFFCDKEFLVCPAMCRAMHQTWCEIEIRAKTNDVIPPWDKITASDAELTDRMEETETLEPVPKCADRLEKSDCNDPCIWIHDKCSLEGNINDNGPVDRVKKEKKKEKKKEEEEEEEEGVRPMMENIYDDPEGLEDLAIMQPKSADDWLDGESHNPSTYLFSAEAKPGIHGGVFPGTVFDESFRAQKKETETPKEEADDAAGASTDWGKIAENNYEPSFHGAGETVQRSNFLSAIQKARKNVNPMKPSDKEVDEYAKKHEYTSSSEVSDTSWSAKHNENVEKFLVKPSSLLEKRLFKKKTERDQDLDPTP
eukprot:g6018.t1